MYAERLGDQVRHNCFTVSPEFVSREDPIQLTVSPVNIVLKDGEGMWIQQVVAPSKNLRPEERLLMPYVEY
ncbi:hypothetical protein Pmani_001132 [Petrolisthes manimaculis]|uniref:Uncharacterized protein n=1 Tax=Petrolisthes manimaculis TaxID=1843537 RepID=A0AAE1QKL7_9EUCA|nr:hypothetical protein Pmani_001132 [Petrolisthes manimaculis]